MIEALLLLSFFVLAVVITRIVLGRPGDVLTCRVCHASGELFMRDSSFECDVLAIDGCDSRHIFRCGGCHTLYEYEESGRIREIVE